MSFNNLGLSDALLKAISEKGYKNPSPIQSKAIPVVLQGKDLLASAQTGTGKTAGFALPMLQNLSAKQYTGRRKVRALILTPTRELAAQVFEDVKYYGSYLNLKSAVIFGGVNQNPQVNAIRSGVDVLVATPGRLIDLNSQNLLSLSDIEVLVLDEADRMLDMGFLRDIKRILSLIPAKRQNLLFSATFSKEIRELANGLLRNPVSVEATPENTTVEKIDQLVYRVDKGNKNDLLVKLINEGSWQQVLVFTRTKHGANKLSEKLSKSKITSAAIHGNKSQGARTKALADFKSGNVRVLVATDIAARGLDIPLLPHVINYELPNIAEDYVHRIGRTGRAGADGQAISLVCIDEVDYLSDIQKLIGIKIPSEIVEGFEPNNIPSEPKKNNGRGGNPRNNNSSRNSNARNSNSGKRPRTEGTKKKNFNRSSRSR
ncbi:MAG: DEAD/DEAH box helicase [Fulvivirga sp.]